MFLKYIVATFLAFIVFVLSACQGEEYHGACDQQRNANLPFCDSSLSIDVRVQDLVSRLSLDEKVGNLWDNATGASENIDLGRYWWWNEALKGIGDRSGTSFRPPTEVATMFPQPVNFASSFNKQLFYEVASAIGNEGRAFYNVGNAGLTFWAPNINIYRDPRWGRGHETPGEDPYLNSEFAHQFVRGLQEPQNGFLKTSACCKHFSAHSVETGRESFDSIVNERDMADTYLPAFKSCIEKANVSCFMCAYNAVNGIPACADKGMLTGLLRDKWGFDGYIVSDCGAVYNILNHHHYTNNPSHTCHAVLDAGMDIACDIFLGQNLRAAVDDGTVPEQMLNTALTRAYKVLFRLGYFEKDAVRPFKELVPAVVDSTRHRVLALEAARQSIVLLKNAPNGRTGQGVLPIDPADLTKINMDSNKLMRASMALIGPHLNASHVFMANYYGPPPFIRTPLEEIKKRVADLEYEFGCDLTSYENSHLNEAEALARSSEQVVLFVGINAEEVEYETGDRINLTLPGLQNELIRVVLAAAQQPVIMFVIAGGPIDLEEWKNDPRVGAIIYSGYIGQSGGEAIADVLFGTYNPAGRLSHTFYKNEFINQVEMTNMNIRPVEGSSPGRTYRFFTGQPVYEFGHGLSYTTFDYSLATTSTEECGLQFELTVRNTGQRAGDHSVLWYVSPPMAGQLGRPIKSLIDFERLSNVQPNEVRQLNLCLKREDFQLANESGEFDVVSGVWMLTAGVIQRDILVT